MFFASRTTTLPSAEAPKQKKWNIKKSETKKTRVPPCLFTIKEVDQVRQEEKEGVRGVGEDNPFLAEIKELKVLTSEDALKKVVHMELKVGEEIKYEAGHSFCVRCPNNRNQVHKILEILQADPHKKIILECVDDDAKGRLFLVSKRGIILHFEIKICWGVT